MKKVYTLVLVFLCVVSLAFASGSQESSDAADALRIAIVSSPSGVDDGSFNEDNYNGILAFIENHPASTVTPVREPTGDTTAAVKAAADIVADYDAEVCSGFQFAEQESGFFAGIAAALETETGKVAVVNGVAFPSNVNYQYGFECGVK